MCPVPLLLHYSVFIKVFSCIQKTKEKAFSIAEKAPTKATFIKFLWGSFDVHLPKEQFRANNISYLCHLKIKIGWRDHNDTYAWFPPGDNFQFCGQITDNLNFLVKTMVAQVWCQQLGDQKNIVVIKQQWIRNSYKWMENQRKKQSITLPL